MKVSVFIYILYDDNKMKFEVTHNKKVQKRLFEMHFFS